MTSPPHLPPSYLLPSRKQGRQEWIFALGTAIGILWVINLSVSNASPRDINHNPPFRAMVIAAKRIQKVKSQVWTPTEKVYVARWASFQKRLQTCFEAPKTPQPQVVEVEMLEAKMNTAGLAEDAGLQSGFSENDSPHVRNNTPRRHRRSHRRHHRWR